MLGTKTILIISFGYMGLLFAIAYFGDKRAEQGRSIISNPYIYALSWAVYCTAWTFYGSVGRAVRDGPFFLTIYIGPLLLATLGWHILRKLIRISKVNRITSIADFIASRYGKSSTLAGVVTIIAVFGIIPYISVQIKAISTTFLLINQYPTITIPVHFADIPVLKDTAFYVSLILAVFAILFGTRHMEATERHEGLVAAIAFESIVKLIAFLAGGIFVTYGIYNGLGDLFSKVEAIPELSKLWILENTAGTYPGWCAYIFLSMLAAMFLPRQFQVIVVENVNEEHLKKAIWLFPLYLLAINIFVLPVAFGGMLLFGDKGKHADTFLLMLPMIKQQAGFVLLIFIGGLSAASGMVIVETVALSTMICNDLVMPVLLRLPFLQLAQRKDLSSLLLSIRRWSIILVLLFGYAYFHFVVEYYELVSIGMISFAAVAQFGPVILGGMFWKGGTRTGAFCGLTAGFLIWAYTLVIPSLILAGFFPKAMLTDGPFGIAFLKPQELFGLDVGILGFDQYVHAVFWSILFNVTAYVVGSLFSRQSAIEQKQAILFVDVFKYGRAIGEASFWRGSTSIAALKSLLTRFLGKARVDQTLSIYARRHNIDYNQTSRVDAHFVDYAEKLLAGAIGSASAHVMVASVVKEEPLGPEEVMNILDETRQVIIYSQELEKATAELKAANERLKELDKLKDDFIATVTHELRTPLTSVRALAEILHLNPELDPEKHHKFSGIIIKESERLSRLINDVLNFQKIESGQIDWRITKVDLRRVIEDSVGATNQLIVDKRIVLSMKVPQQVPLINGDQDRLIQVMVNLISNAVKFNDCDQGQITIGLNEASDHLHIYLTDNGIGISPEDQKIIFDKFRQVKNPAGGRPRGTGLGLAITRSIIAFHGGRIWVESTVGKGSTFHFTLPLAGHPFVPEEM
jgi:Na+/proline symporter/nitrogen-specific signal transduction histidine kinase